jgi:catalase
MRHMGDSPKKIKIRHIRHCMKADPNYGEGLAKALDIPMSEIEE